MPTGVMTGEQLIVEVNAYISDAMQGRGMTKEETIAFMEEVRKYVQAQKSLWGEVTKIASFPSVSKWPYVDLREIARKAAE